ncbi:MAG TPA: hypothetical protein VKA60_21190 [Blastocatellia bacterium]|nr:hypothetical protein [Blastocatellia bacterium]
MSDRVKNLIDQLAREEDRVRATEFLAPCVRGGRIRARVSGLVYTFTPRPPDFEGWGVFLPASDKEAELLDEAELSLIGEYLKLLKPLRARLVARLRGTTWLAYPANESDFEQRFGATRPILIHLVGEGEVFEQMLVRTDGSAFWFEAIDRRSDPLAGEALREAASAQVAPAALRFKGMTHEMRVAYELARQPLGSLTDAYARKRRRVRPPGAQHEQSVPDFATEAERDEWRLREALRVGGGDLQGFTDRGDYWVVEWTTRGGHRHTSAISKAGLTVISSGICLSGRDRDFDLQSLVGVIEGDLNW